MIVETKKRELTVMITLKEEEALALVELTGNLSRSEILSLGLTNEQADIMIEMYFKLMDCSEVKVICDEI